MADEEKSNRNVKAIVALFFAVTLLAPLCEGIGKRIGLWLADYKPPSERQKSREEKRKYERDSEIRSGPKPWEQKGNTANRIRHKVR